MDETSAVNTQQTQQNPQVAIPKKHKFLRYILAGSVIVLSIGFLFTVNSKSRTHQGISSTSNIKPLVKEVQPSLAPVPFQEMTIPFLREKKYPSYLGNLEQLYTGSNYTTYLTSYTSDELKIYGLLTKPTGDMPRGGWPAIVFIHGYIPPLQYQSNGEAYSSYVDYLAQNGIVVFKIDLRGHGNSEGHPGGGYYGSDYVTDALSARAALASSDFVHPKKIGMWGHSMAGNTVMRAMAASPDIPAGVIWAGAVYTYVDMQKYRINDASYQPPQNDTERQQRRRELFEKHGSPSAQSVFWRQVAPTNFLSDLKGAIALHHAVDDPVVNIGYSRDLNALLDNTTVPHELYEYDYGGHNITGGSFTLAMQRTVEFFKKHLE